MKFKYFFLTSLLCSSLWTGSIFAQASQNQIRITGVVYDANNHLLVGALMIINKTTQQGFFAGANGQFQVSCDKKDTIIVGATGYKTLQICFKDSGDKTDFFTRLYMHKLSVQLKEAEVIGHRDLDDIQKDIEKLGYKKEDYMLSGVDAFYSPITFLYQQFSRRERSKRDVAEMRNNDRRRELLKELFRKYVDNDVIQLPDEEFDTFIDFCQVNDEFMKQATQYEFIMYVKRKFQFYQALKGK